MNTDPLTVPFYPARPINGGPLPKALPKNGRWIYEPKVNGWRALLHTPSGALFNRHGERLSIAHEFKDVLTQLKGATTDPDFEWLDVEAFERRHPLGRGSLVLLDLPCAPGNYEQRQAVMGRCVNDCSWAQSWPQEQFPPPENTLLVFAYRYETGDDTDPLLAWPRLQAVNRALQCDLFEGLVAKRADSTYPLQRRSPSVEFPFWMKHRWAF